ncbi:ferritin-like domain-containing protein [Microvirga splendida]|uniref:Bacterioferritin n=1 Tax=Microvirga splendida TaxID=2795727 RepID=A0ABS0XZR5_9HYPH|nr:bacterioferritin [Microvirga splendida]MBJ6125546.1 bacterioferritin [Microvirga splendida]
MKGDARVIEYLNRGLRHELTAVNQPWQHSRTLADWGYNDLAKKWHEETAEERQHADRFIERIIFLEGVPNMQELNPLRIGRSKREVLENDLAVESDARDLCGGAAAYCDSIGDRVSKDHGGLGTPGAQRRNGGENGRRPG